jgi:hypothetical protein
MVVEKERSGTIKKYYFQEFTIENYNKYNLYVGQYFL